MIGSIFRKISKTSYYKSLCLHLALIILVIIPLSYFIPQYLDSGTIISSGEVKLITMSEDDYKKIIGDTTKIAPIAPTARATKNDTQNSPFIKVIKKTNTQIPPKPQKKIISKKDVIKNTTISPKPILRPTTVSTPLLPKNEIIENTDDADSGISAIVDEDKIKDNNAKNLLLEQDPVDIISTDIPKTTIFGTTENVSSEDIKISIKDIIAVQINKCWNEYYSQDSSLQKFVVTAVIGYRQNGTVNKIDIENKFILSDTDANTYDIMIQNAKKAIINCSPLKGLPEKSFDEWKFIKINFRHNKKS